VPAEMGQIDRRRRRRRRGYARRLPPRTFAPAYRLDKTSSIDGGRGSGCRQIELASWGGQIAAKQKWQGDLLPATKNRGVGGEGLHPQKPIKTGVFASLTPLPAISLSGLSTGEPGTTAATTLD